jgi:NADPH:quinone reductase-like Zn-dependent oxidoreductase
MGAEAVVDHSKPLPPQLKALGWPVVDAIANFSDLDAHWEAMAELIRPEGLIVAIVSSRGPLDLNRLKEKSAGFVWEYMFTRPRGSSDDLTRRGQILAALAAAIDAGALRTTLRETMGPDHGGEPAPRPQTAGGWPHDRQAGIERLGLTNGHELTPNPPTNSRPPVPRH